jgi:hypothetical protein
MITVVGEIGFTDSARIWSVDSHIDGPRVGP